MIEQPIENEDAEDDDGNYDSFYGKGGLLNKGVYDDDDREADETYSAVDEKLEQRHKKRKKQDKDETVSSGATKISQLYEAERLALKSVTEEQWMNLPEARRMTKRKQESSRGEKFTPVPDSVIASALQSGAITTSIDPSSGVTTSVFASGTATGQIDVATMYAARNQATAIKLQHVFLIPFTLFLLTFLLNSFLFYRHFCSVLFFPSLDAR